jgi:TonB-dependent receptor
MKALTALLALIATFSVLFAAPSGKISGQVKAADSGEPLPGANVFLQGTKLGASSDLNGRFVIPIVPAGRYKLVVRYIGYQTKSIDVVVGEDQELKEVVALNPEAVQGEVIVVTAQAEGQLGAINQQLASDKIVNIVSEQRIQELPDFNAAQAISRLPGVSTVQSSGEANKVVIRGLAPQYNAVEVEGVKLASTGSSQIGASSLENTAGQLNNDRSVDISMVTPYMIKSISVYKSLTPDLNANAIGGTVNMELREAPSGLRHDLLYQSGYTQKSNTYGNYRAVGSVSTRFFSDQLGLYFLGNIEAYDRDADNMNAGYNTRSTEIGENGFAPVTVSNVTLNRHLETRKRFGGNLILDYRLPNGSLKAVNMFTRLNSDFTDHRMQLIYSGPAAGDITFSYQEGENEIDLGVHSLDLEYDFDLFSMDLKAAYTTSRNSLPRSPRLSFRQNRGIDHSQVKENTRPENLTRFITFGGDSAVFLRDISLFSSDYKEKNQSYKADFKFPLSVGSSLSGFFKFGGAFRHEKHENDQETPYAGIGGGQPNQLQGRMTQALIDEFGLYNDPGTRLFPASEFTSRNRRLFDIFLNNDFGPFLYAANASIPNRMIDFISNDSRFVTTGASGPSTATDPGGWFNGPYQQLANDYTYIEDYYAGYLMAELNFLSFTAVGGVRYEKDKAKYSVFNMRDARDPLRQVWFEVTSRPENEFWLPMGQIKYKATDWMDIRCAYTQTLARPDYHQLSPHYTVSASRQINSGNPDLKPAEAFNHDVIVSFHGNKLGLLSIGAFRKRVKDFTYFTQYVLNQATKAAGLDSVERFQTPALDPNLEFTLNTYINSEHDATVKGFEVDFQTNFWYMPSPLNGVVFGINYTRIESETKYPWRDQYTVFVPPRSFRTALLDTTRTGRLINQPNDILNTYLGYDYKGFSARASFVFQGNSVSSIGLFAERDGFSKDYFRMDISARQKLPWQGSELFLDIVNVNNENNVSAQRSIGGFTNIQNYGLTANLGIRFRR